MPLATMIMLATCFPFSATGEDRPITVIDLTALNELDPADPAQAREAWDTLHLVASVQGIVNREGPRLFVRFMPQPDDFWFKTLRAPGAWLADRPVEKVRTVENLLRRFADVFAGVVVYDDRVPATSNLASTIAGVEDRPCLRFDPAEGSLYRRVKALALPFTRDEFRLMAEDGGPLFTGKGVIPGTDQPSTGSAKCDAYLWAKARYLDTGRCSKAFMAYYLDAWWLRDPTVSGLSNATLTNHDFFISRRAFFFDLHVWEEESPIDDRGQAPGTDGRTLEALLQSMYRNAEGEVFQIGGFIPWAWKYTNAPRAGGHHGGVDTEWKYAQMVSKYRGVMDADALGFSGMSNASFYHHYPLKKHYPQNPRPNAASLRKRGLLDARDRVAPHVYICFYMGDYDSAAWLNYHVPLWWADPAHGTIPCAWAINPNLDARAPHVFDYVRTHQTGNDWFIFGDGGAGYLNPGMLAVSNGWEAWVRHNKPYAERYDLSITGFIIDGHSPGMGEAGLEAYLRISPDGLAGQKIPPRGVYRGTMPYLRMALDLDGAPEDAGARVAGMAGVNAPKFFFIRTILKSPSWHKAVMEKARSLNPNIEFVDPYTFFLLLKRHEMSPVEDRGGSLAPLRFTPPEDHAGLAPIAVGDGPFHHAHRNGRDVIVQEPGDRLRYLYFEVDEHFSAGLAGTNGDVVIEVDLYDNTPGKVGVQYDAREGSSYRNGPEVTLAGTGAWRTVVFNLPGAHFAHGQNGGADFRLVNFGGGLLLSEVRVRRK